VGLVVMGLDLGHGERNALTSKTRQSSPPFSSPRISDPCSPLSPKRRHTDSQSPSPTPHHPAPGGHRLVGDRPWRRVTREVEGQPQQLILHLQATGVAGIPGSSGGHPQPHLEAASTGAVNWLRLLQEARQAPLQQAGERQVMSFVHLTCSYLGQFRFCICNLRHWP
jgi:hypothetical protein